MLVCALMLFTTYGVYFEASAATVTLKSVVGTTTAESLNLVNGNVYTLSNNETVNLTHELCIPAGSSVTIQGYGTIKRTTAFGQNMIQNSGTLKIHGTSADQPIIIDNNSLSGWTAVWNAGGGNIELKNVIIEDAGNSDATAPAFRAYDNTTDGKSTTTSFENVTIRRSTGKVGAAICIDGNTPATFPMKNSTIDDCNTSVTSSFGSAIYISGSEKVTATITNTTIKNCAMTSPGETDEDGCLGTVFISNSNSSSTFTFDGVTFEKNTIIDGSGGGICFGSLLPASAVVNIKNCVFNACQASNGSAIHLAGPGSATVNVSNTLFTGCATNTGEGGTIRTSGNGKWKLNMTDSVMRGNTSQKLGGGLYWNASGDGANLKIEDCQFINNSSVNQGGGLFLEGTNITITGTGTPGEAYDGNTAPTAITGTLVQGNTSNYGGGIYYKSVNTVDESAGAEINLNSSNIEVKDNKATYDGGGLAYVITEVKTASGVSNIAQNAHYELNINGAKLIGNTAGRDGGAVYIGQTSSIKDGTSVLDTVTMDFNFSSGTISNNTAGSNGGAISITDGNVVIGVENCAADHSHPKMQNNTAGTNGGGIAISGGTTTMYCGNIIDNTAKNSESNNYYQIGNSSFTVTGGTFGEGVKVWEGDYIDTRPGVGETIIVTFYNYFNGEILEEKNMKVVIINGKYSLPTKEEIAFTTQISGYSIYGWSTVPGESSGENFYLAGHSMSLPHSMSFYTVWIGQGSSNGGTQYDITYDLAGGSFDKNITYDVNISLDGVKDNIYNNSLVIETTKYTNASKSVPGKMYVINSGTGLYIFAEIYDTSLLNVDSYSGAHDAEYVEFFIDFRNDHATLYPNMTDDQADVYRNQSTSPGSVGWITVNPENTLATDGGMMSIASSIQHKVTVVSGVRYDVEIYVPFPSDFSLLNTKSIGLGIETYNKDAVSTSNSGNYLYASGNYTGQYYRRYDYLDDYYITANTEKTNPTNYSFTTEDKVLNFCEPTNPGYVFNGWTLSMPNGGNFTVGKIGDALNIMNKYGDIKLTATWTTGTYTASYNLNGGTIAEGANPSTFTAAVTLKDPVKPGYTFSGWYDVHTKKIVTSLATGRNYALYAAWDAKTYTATFNANGGNVSSGSTSVSYKYTDTLAVPTVSQSGYVFLGWYVTEITGDTNWELGEPYSGGKTSKYGTVTFTAVWVTELIDNTFSFTCDNVGEQGYWVSITGTARATAYGNIDIKILVKPSEKSFSIKLPVGDYVITVEDSHSWRYEIDEFNIALLSKTTYLFDIGNSQTDKWLNAYAYNNTDT